jgi:ABC-2 type transport system permease protein
MNQIKAVFKFEYTNYIKSKAYIIFSIILLAAAMIVGFLPNIISLLPSGDSSSTSTVDSGKNETAFFWGEGYTPEMMSSYLPNFNWVQLDNADEAQVKVESEQGKIAIVVNGGSYKLYQRGSDMMNNNYQSTINALVSSVYKATLLQKSGIPESEIQEVVNFAPKADVVSIGKDVSTSFWAGYFLLFLLYMVILMYGQFVMTSVVTEKTSKTMEVLVTAAKPFSLIFGKVTGVACAGLTQFGVFTLVGGITFAANKDSWGSFSVTAGEVISTIVQSGLFFYAFVFFILGFFSFAFLYAAVGSTVNRIEDSNAGAILPTLLFMSAFFIAMFGMVAPEASYFKIFSFLPLWSPMIMFARICTSVVPFWESFIAIILNIFYIFIVAFISAKIYRAGIMLYGTKITPKHIFEAIKG